MGQLKREDREREGDMRVGGGEEHQWGLGMEWVDGERIPWHQAQECN